MSATRKPWIKWYGADWRADPALRMCGFAARGLWIDLLTLMQEAEPFGHLVIKGTIPTTAQLASLLGGAEREVKRLLAELKQAGVYSVTDDGVIYSRRMVRDKAKAEKDSANGGRGGNPILKPIDKPEDNAGVNPPDKAHMPETRDQRPEPNLPTPSPQPATADWAGCGRAVKAIIAEHWPNDEALATAQTGVCSQWLANGWDAELDILPTVRAVCSESILRGHKPNGLKYFAPAIARHHAERKAIASGPAEQDPELEAKLRAQLEAAYHREGSWNENWAKWRDHWGSRPDRRKDAA